MTPQQLSEEATFADAQYAPFAGNLGLNRAFYEKYANPQSDRDWRQHGAKLLGPVAGLKVLAGC
jgi:hypothetical protein